MPTVENHPVPFGSGVLGQTGLGKAKAIITLYYACFWKM